MRSSSPSLRHIPGFRRVLNASLLSNVGTAVALLATAYVSFSHSRSIVHTAIVATAYSMPAVVVGQWAGRLVHTHDRRWIIIVTDVAQMLVWIGVALLAVAGWLDPWWLTLASLLAGLAGAIQFPAWRTFEQALVPADRLAEATALLSSRSAMARIFGAVAGGFALTWAGPRWLFLFNALTFVPIIVVVALRLSHPQRQLPDPGPTSVRAEVDYARTQPTVRKAMGMVMVLTLLAVPIASLLPAVADQLGEGAHALGLVTAFYSLGGSLVAVVLRRVTRNRPRGALLTPAVFSCGVSLAIIGVLGGVLGGVGRQIAVVACLVPIGLGLTMAQAVLQTTLQLSSSPDMQGRMLALYAAVVSVLAPVGAITLAAISQATSVWLSVAIAGALLTVFGCVMVVVRPAAQAVNEASSHPELLRQHVLQLGRHAVGFLHPGQFQPSAAGPDGSVAAPPNAPAAPPPGGHG